MKYGAMQIQLLRCVDIVGVDPCSVEVSEEARIDRLSVGWQFGHGRRSGRRRTGVIEIA